MRLIRVATGCLLVIAFRAFSADVNEPIHRLDWLIGAWEFDDVAVNGEYREAGTRDCAYALNETYILCKSAGTSNKGKTRNYHFYFKFNRTDDRFEMIALTGYYPRTDLYVLDVSDDNRTIELATKSWTKDGLKPQNEATIVYNGDNQYVWEIRHGEVDENTGRLRVSFRDTVTRR